MDTDQTKSQVSQSLPSTPHPPVDASGKNLQSFFVHRLVLTLFFIIAAVVIVAASIAGGVYLYRANNKYSSSQNTAFQGITQLFNQKNSNPPQNSSTNAMNHETGNTPTLQATLTAPIAQNQNFSGKPTGLQTYTNSTDKFSFNYATGMQLKETPQGLGVATVELRKSDNTDSSNAPNVQFLIFPKTLGKLIGQDFDSTYALADGSTKTMKDVQGNAQIFTKVHNRSVNGLRAFDYTTTANPPDPNLEAEIGDYIEIGGNVVITSSGESEKAALETVLASFKYPLN